MASIGNNSFTADDIFYVGVNDRGLDLFEGQYEIPNGISYNSYVIMDEKIAVMDTVDKRKAAEFMEKLKMIKIVTHVADARSCVLHPASTTHRQLSSADLEAIGIKDNLIRLSVGIENAEDIIEDIRQALESI